LKATPAQINSTIPNGHVPAKKPYALASTQPQPNAKMKPRPRRSSAYISIMNVTAAAPNAVSILRSVTTLQLPPRVKGALSAGA
jgi:hypothetical protein